jgi:aspartate/methionine/tyrosine aminotransferase
VKQPSTHLKVILTRISEYRERRDTLITELHKIEGAKVATPKELSTIAELPIEMQTILLDAF